jgi:flagellar basal-body rod protein FlgB
MLISGSDPVGATLRAALDGLALQERVAANDIANVDTPGFTASTVDFEDSLRSALADGVVDPQEVAPVVTASPDSAGLNGNNVDLGAETMTQMQATFRYQLLSRAVGDRYALVRDAIGGL